MRILFITQKVDKDDDILGVYHRWLEELAKKAGHIYYVICLFKGRSELPRNVSVYSLGKESGCLRIKYVWRFYKYLWRLRNSYDKVFVHMNPEYVILGWFYWKLSGKKIILWYNHPLGNIRAKLAIKLADVVLFTSPFSFASKFKKSRQMPVGIDTDLMKPEQEVARKEKSVLFVGRVSPIKKVEILLEAARILARRNVDFSVTIVGNPTPGKLSEENYARRLKTTAHEFGLEKVVTFSVAVPYLKIASVYAQHDIFVNLTPTGSFDKTIFEAMSSGLLTLVSNKSLKELISPKLRQLCLFKEGEPADLAQKIETLLNLSPKEQAVISRELRGIVLENHSLSQLINELVKFIA